MLLVFEAHAVTQYSSAQGQRAVRFTDVTNLLLAGIVGQLICALGHLDVLREVGASKLLGTQRRRLKDGSGHPAS